MKNFALIGAAGYIAPRHMKAIKETGNNLVAVLDRHDAVGVIDSYFPEADFFVEFERFDRHIEKLRRLGNERKIHYVSITSPNYLHDAHMRFALRVSANAICEKPLVLNPWNVDALKEMEQENGSSVCTILQLRLHPAIVKLKEETAESSSDRKVNIDLTYITSRGHWYLISWKGDPSKSGGIATNIGIHFFDMLQWIFGKTQWNVVHLSAPTKAAGFLELEKARVRWFLSLDKNDLPQSAREQGKTTFRSIMIDGKEVEFSDGFTDLHTVSYEQILSGNGFGLDDARPSIETVFEIRNAKEAPLRGEYHPFLKTIKK
ncbi:MAG: UDP-N-acetyl-2-amino-2-deoxy-D-glucuronate oxidase [Syntrophorhabdus sp. PtaU1.Bin153]|nr:MAG: UDP-N-acetyl-2-amino-2-deoxy-D-glucuronate oxidase [Syntrophorhabdus sp. PtaU1.Bin153]